MDTFLLNAQRIFDAACADCSAEPSDFALFVRRDGGIHMVMEAGISLPARMAYHDAQAAYRVTRSQNGVKVRGANGSRRCELEEKTSRDSLPALLRDQPLYRITSPLPISTAG
ncbi:MAG: hypothetical protein KGN84_20255 [Acidobacteriota bacterium]|nr:hypothetical protein [Acidobacteriota bacterium]